MSSLPTVAVVDIGSTTIRYGQGTRRGPKSVQSEPTQASALPSQLVAIVERITESAMGPIRHIAVSTTGLVDAERGVICEFDTADGETIHEIPIGPTLEESFGVPVSLENDCTTAALGEATFGAGSDFETVAHVTFGTGIGAGVVVDERPFRGEHGYAAEVGLIPVVADGELSSTGVRGAWEAYCSGRGIPAFARHLLSATDHPSKLRGQESITAQNVFAAAETSDEFAQACLDRVARYNAAGLGAVVNTYDPGIITLGGSVALKNAEWMLDGIRERVDEYTVAEPPTIQLTSLGSDTELYGAAAAFFGSQEQADPIDQFGTSSPPSSSR
ncbi:ROK family protein [Halobium palmae]|uniref:ROK family protein n=1 Tax=Halobium palmae TaxID=1776492 RepID=A0ABD5RVM7_9EURY